jgi:hypothetical protein
LPGFFLLNYHIATVQFLSKCKSLNVLCCLQQFTVSLRLWSVHPSHDTTSDDFNSRLLCNLLKTFLLIYDSCTGGFIVTFSYIYICIYVYIGYPGLVHPLHYFPSFPTSLLSLTLTGFSVSYSCMYRTHIHHIQPPLSSSFALAFLLVCSFFTWPILYPCPSLFQCLFIVHWEFYHGILPTNILYFNQSSNLYYSFLPFSPFPVLLNSLQCISLCFIPTHYYSLPILFLFSSSLVSSIYPTFGDLICIYICYSIMYICIYMIMLIFVFGSIFHIWEKTCDCSLSEPD